MTDSSPWQPPAGSTPVAPPSPYAAPAGAPLPPPGAPGWTPPPKPGLIPLRPLTLGTMLAAAFQVLRRNPRPTFGFSLLVTGVTSVVSLLVVGLVTFLAFSRTLTATGDDAETIGAGAVALTILSALVPAALSVVGSALLQGVISLEVARATLGEKLRLGGLLRRARGRIGALLGWSGILFGALAGGIAIIAVIVALLVAFGGTAGVVVGVLLALLAGAVGLVAAVWLGTKVSLVPSVLLLERLPLRAAIARSWSLTTGFFWKTFGVQALVIVIVQVVAGVITTPLSILLGLGSAFLDPNGTNEGMLVGGIVLYVLTLVVTVVFGAIAAVVQSATPALLYIDIRMRKEGLDLELSRFVEARQAGTAGVADPYLPTGAPGAATAPAPSSWS